MDCELWSHSEMTSSLAACLREGSWTRRENVPNHLWTGVCMNPGKLAAAVLNLKRDCHRHKGGGKGEDAVAF